MAIKRVVHERCQTCGAPNAKKRADGSIIMTHSCPKVPGPPNPPKVYREGEVDFVPANNPHVAYMACTNCSHFSPNLCRVCLGIGFFPTDLTWEQINDWRAGRAGSPDLFKAACDVLGLIDEVGDGAQDDRVFAQFEFGDLRTAVAEWPRSQQKVNRTQWRCDALLQTCNDLLSMMERISFDPHVPSEMGDELRSAVAQVKESIAKMP